MLYDSEPAHSWNFGHVSVPRTLEDPGERRTDSLRPARPKFRSFDATPGVYNPRPFQQQQRQRRGSEALLDRERRGSDGYSPSWTSEEEAAHSPRDSDTRSQASSVGSGGETESKARERIIPITLEADTKEELKSAAKPEPMIEKAEPMTEAPPQRPARKYSRRNGTAEPPQQQQQQQKAEEETRDERARSVPTQAKLTPLHVDAAMTSQARGVSQPPGYGRPNYLNSSPNPYSPGARPAFGSLGPSFGTFVTSDGPPRGQSNSDTSAAQRPPPKIAPKPSAVDLQHRAARPPLRETRSDPVTVTVLQDAPVRKTSGDPTQLPSTEEATQETPSPRETALQEIGAVRSEVAALSRRLSVFAGSRGSREYLLLDELLTRQLIRLDGVATGGDVEVRAMRKQAIACVQESLAMLERSAQLGGEQGQPQGLVRAVPVTARGGEDDG